MRAPLVAVALLLAACSDATGPTPERPEFYTSLPGGKLMGLWDWPPERWGDTPMSTTLENATHDYIVDRLKRARAANLPVMLGMPRRYLTTTGENVAPFSLINAKRSVDLYAELLRPLVADYAPWIAGWYLVDEPFCAGCWGGKAASASDIKELARYFRERIDPNRYAPLMIRVPPSILDNYGDWGTLIDVAWVVWNTNRGLSPKAYMDREWSIAQAHGWQMVGGINAEDCHGNKTAPCTAEELRAYYPDIITHPGVCLVGSWKFTETTWSESSIRDAWTDLVALARSQPTVRCGRRISGGETPTSDGTVARVDLTPNSIACVVGDRVSVSATVYDASGATLDKKVFFRASNDRIEVVATGARTATVRCLTRGSAYAIAGREGVRDRSPVSAQ